MKIVTNTSRIIIIGSLLITSYISEGCKQKKAQTSDHKGQMFVQIRTLQNPDKSWGYNIIANGKIAIKQPFIPVIPGEKGFRSAEDAHKTAQRVIDKTLKTGSSALDSSDLKSLGIIQ